MTLEQFARPIAVEVLVKLRVWTGRPMGRPTYEFMPFLGAEECYEVLLPPGWALVPDDAHGVVLASLRLEMALSAHSVFLAAMNEAEGFRVASVQGL